MATKSKDTVGVVYVGPHSEVEVTALPGLRFEYGVGVEVAATIAAGLLEQEDAWKAAANFKPDPKRRAHARAVLDAEAGPPDEAVDDEPTTDEKGDDK